MRTNAHHSQTPSARSPTPPSSAYTPPAHPSPASSQTQPPPQAPPTYPATQPSPQPAESGRYPARSAPCRALLLLPRFCGGGFWLAAGSRRSAGRVSFRACCLARRRL